MYSTCFCIDVFITNLLYLFVESMSFLYDKCTVKTPRQPSHTAEDGRKKNEDYRLSDLKTMKIIRINSIHHFTFNNHTCLSIDLVSKPRNITFYQQKR